MTTVPLRFEDDGEKVKVLVATDITLHRRKPTNPHTLHRQLSKSARNGQPGRAYAESFRAERRDEVVHVSGFFPYSDEDRRRLDDLKAQGRTIEFVVPENLPIFIRD
jgi:hypothetical protein